jgi:4-diphosphocytidyl-2-C-methyl-D-erythritol kinase
MTGGRLVEYAHAKVNLYLHVVGRRADGYHLLDSLAVFAGAHDVLSGVPAEAMSFALSGRFGGELRQEDQSSNLVMKAAALLRAALEQQHDAGRDKNHDKVASLLLEKNLPVASGIGGGSADAAAALRLLRRLWADGTIKEARLDALALSLGADVPVCLNQRPARMGGVGEVLGPAPKLPDCAMVLVNCGVGVSTPAVFRAREEMFRPPAELPDSWPDAVSLAADLAGLHNDLEPAAIALCPPIADVLSAIGAQPGCLLARMSGSGATCFGLFATEAEAAAAAASLSRPDWWVWGGALHRSRSCPIG